MAKGFLKLFVAGALMLGYCLLILVLIMFFDKIT